MGITPYFCGMADENELVEESKKLLSIRLLV